MNIVAIVQARMGSTRLPGKVLKKIKNKYIIDYVIDRLRICKNLNNIVLATTTSEKDNILEDFSIKKKLNIFRGDENDVLRRYFYAAKKYNADIIIRVTSDCPLIDPWIVDRIINKHIDFGGDYTSNTIVRSYPRGLDVEVLNFNALEEAFKNANKKYQREHVTPYIKENKDEFKLQSIEAQKKLKRPDIRITLDTLEDFKFISIIINHFNDLYFKTEDVIDFLEERPHLLKINKHIKQKNIKE